MNFWKRGSRLAGLTLLCGVLVSAQTLIQPGQLNSGPASPPLTGNFSTLTSPRYSIAANIETPHDRIVRKVWIGSMLAMAGASGLDAATSWGKLEGNGFLASGNGTFGARGLSIKAAMAAAVLLPQALLRNHKELRVKFAVANLVEAGIFTGVSIHNLGVSAPAH